MFPGRQLTYTTMGTDQQTKRISTTLTTGCKILFNIELYFFLFYE